MINIPFKLPVIFCKLLIYQIEMLIRKRKIEILAVLTP